MYSFKTILPEKELKNIQSPFEINYCHNSFGSWKYILITRYTKCYTNNNRHTIELYT